MPQTSIAEVRKQYPQYDDLSDQQLADGLHQKFYSDLPKEDFYQRIGLNQSPQDQLASLGRLPTDPPAMTEAERTAPKGGNMVSRAIGNFADQKLFPGPAGSIVQGAERVAENIAADPIQTLVIDPLTAPSRAAHGYVEGVNAAARGDFREAGKQAVEGLTAAGESALIFAPGATVASRGAGVAARPVARTGAQQFIEDAARVGIEPTLPAAYPGTAGRIAKPLSENALGGVTTRASARENVKQSETALNRQADAFSIDADYYDAGGAAVEGAKRQLKARPASQINDAQFLTFREKANRIYDDAFAPIDMQAKYAPQATASALKDITSRFDNAELQELFALPRTEKLRAAIERAGELTINDLRDARTAIREIQNHATPFKSVDDAALERLEGALTEDIFAGVEATTGKAAAQKLRVADRFYRRNITSIRLALKPFLKEGVTQEDAFEAILRAAQGQGRGDIRQLRALRRSLTPQQMDDVSAGVIRRLGRAKEGGQFSVETFTTKWQSMSEEAKSTLFNRAQRPELRQNLDSLARVLERQAEVEKLANRSNSGSGVVNIGSIAYAATHIGSNPVGVIAGIVGANGMGRLLMSPSFTRALVDLQKLAPTLSTASAAHQKGVVLANLNRAAKADPAIRGYVVEITNALEHANDNINREVERQTQGLQ